jgi:hypothetical protein
MTVRLVCFGDEPLDVRRLEVPVEQFLAGPVFVESEMPFVIDDGRPDIVAPGVSVLLGNGDGSFTLASQNIGVGRRNTPFLADLTGDDLPDSVILNGAGTGLYGLDTTAATPTLSSLGQSVSLAAADFTGNGRNDLLIVNRGSDSFSILANDGQGGFANPRPVLTTSTSDNTEINTQAGPTVAGHFHEPKKPIEVAILMKDRAEVWIFTGNGEGAFRHTLSIPAGDQPTGLNLFHNPQTGLDDLLVGDSFGDVLHL